VKKGGKDCAKCHEGGKEGESADGKKAGHCKHGEKQESCAKCHEHGEGSVESKTHGESEQK
jgi:hypothetical protein